MRRHLQCGLPPPQVPWERQRKPDGPQLANTGRPSQDSSLHAPQAPLAAWGAARKDAGPGAGQAPAGVDGDICGSAAAGAGAGGAAGASDAARAREAESKRPIKAKRAGALEVMASSLVSGEAWLGVVPMSSSLGCACAGDGKRLRESWADARGGGGHPAGPHAPACHEVAPVSWTPHAAGL